MELHSNNSRNHKIKAQGLLSGEIHSEKIRWRGSLCEADVLDMCLECRWGVWEEMYHAEEEIIGFIPKVPGPGGGVSMSCGTAGVAV